MFRCQLLNYIYTSSLVFLFLLKEEKNEYNLRQSNTITIHQVTSTSSKPQPRNGLLEPFAFPDHPPQTHEPASKWQPAVSSHMPPSDCSSASQHYSSPSRRQKVCGACGDRAKSYHFGGISCDSCKAFFRRSVQNEAYKNFHCPYEGKCEITITSRKCCQFCRFKKCLSIGMETGWVMTEEERLALVKNRMERKQRQGVSEPSSSARNGKSLIAQLLSLNTNLI
ncbi:nuclear hormone receptor family member nhr-48 [Trichonephila inaurata madagascariensis]|uniref:Nuclear hormone receptor family member nhr-48 n=1 Tax=Trichonephila inaurata madagascariensis TaxID=2747483 RepID=A0A8X6WWJ8_9ARAC|nr:nuclear hormone receptor family member nhr-48 [Trichonephila inaurata madagascariensis]